MLSRSSKSKNAKTTFAKKGLDSTKEKRKFGFTINDLKNLGQKIKDHFRWKHTPRDFQLEAIRAQLQRKDVLVHAGTGSGKTFIAAGPHAVETSRGFVTFMVSPLIALQAEQVRVSSNLWITIFISVMVATGRNI